MHRNRSLPFAFLLIGIGVVLLLQQAEVISEDVDLGPIVLIGIGLFLLVERFLTGGPGVAGLIVPLVIVAIGLGLLLQDVGAFDDDVIAPLIAIAIGLGLVLGAVGPRRSEEDERVEVDLAGAGRARAQVEHGAGELRIGSHVVGGNLVEGRAAGGAEVRQRREGDLLDVTLRSRFSRFRGRGLDWSITFAREVPLELVLKTGASRTEADLSDLQVTSLRVDTGASSTRVTLPSSGRPDVRIHAGAAEIKVAVPGRMAARIEVRGGVSDVRVDELRFPREGGVFRSKGYDDAPSRADVVIEAGAASVTVS
jgi:hypothetical protein